MNAVTRIAHEGGGSHVEPPLDQAWDELTKLRWHAEVVAVDTGKRCEVRGAKYRIDDRLQVGFFNVHYRGKCGVAVQGPMDFRSAWDWLNGFAAGAKAGEA